jgi:hypothetical protein
MTNRVIGTTFNYLNSKGRIKVRVIMDTEEGTLKIYTPGNPKVETTSLPEGFSFIPAIQNKSSLNNNVTLKALFNFDNEDFESDED